MITNSGKEVLSKYLLGQTSAYATHIAIGCGATPLDQTDEAPAGMELKDTLDFEMLRVPISSRGFVEENGISKISFTAQLPTENRYEITEIGLWSSGSNSLARGFDSKIIFDFEENWEAHDTTIRPILLKDPLGSEGNIDDGGDKVFRVLTDNSILSFKQRFDRKEGPRFLNSSIFMRGDTSEIVGSDGSWNATEESTHIHLNNISFNIGGNSASDVLTLAFSLVDKDALGNGNPEFVKILVEFFRNEINTENGYAKAEIYIPGSEFSDRYKAVQIPISDLITSPDFSSSEVRVARIFAYVAVEDGTDLVGSTNHYISLDGFRLDNISTNNPLYKMVGYSITKTDDGRPIIKFKNTNNYIEFRFGVGVT
jgi:hypothetical protein